MESLEANPNVLAKIPRPHLDGVELAVQRVDVARLKAFWRKPTPIRQRRAVMELSPRAVRQREGRIPFPNAGELSGQVSQLLRNQMNDLALALFAATHGNNAGGQDGAAVLLEDLCQTTRLAMPLSSSRVMNMTPLALPSYLEPAAITSLHRLGASNVCLRVTREDPAAAHYL